jgi:hypothetical protein
MVSVGCFAVPRRELFVETQIEAWMGVLPREFFIEQARLNIVIILVFITPIFLHLA